MEAEQTAAARPRPTPADMAAGTAGGGGYVDDSFAHAVRQYGDYSIERFRVGRRPVGGAAVGANPAVLALVRAITGGRVAAGQGGAVNHVYSDILLRHPDTGERHLIRAGKGPRLHVEAADGGVAGVDGRKGYTGLDISDRVRQQQSFRDFAADMLTAHAASHGGDYSAIGRYGIRDSNCQSATAAAVAAATGTGVCGIDRDIRDFAVEPLAAQVPRRVAALIDGLAARGAAKGY